MTDAAFTQAVCRVALAAALLLGCLARAATFQSPLFDFHAWRQTDTATIARNFYRGSLNPLHPQIDTRGAQADGGVETGFEILAFLVALLARLVGFHDHLGRLVSAMSFPLAGLLLYRFARDRYGPAVGISTVWIYAFGCALSMFIDRAFMNESLLALLSILSLRAAQQYLAGRPRSLITLIVASVLIAIIKPPYLAIWPAIAGLFAERHGWRAFGRWEIWLAVAADLFAMALWFTHAHAMFARTGLTFGVADKLFDANLLFSWEYARLLFSRFIRDLLGPIALVAAVYGLGRSLAERRIAEAGGVLGFVLYLIVATGGNYHHNYYQLQVIPIAAVLAGLGTVSWINELGDRRGWGRATRLYGATTITALCVLSAFVRSVNFHSWYELGADRVQACADLRPRLAPDDLVAFFGYLSPDILYCLDRRGWALGEEWVTAKGMRQIAAEGADVIVVPADQIDKAGPLDDLRGETLPSPPNLVAFRTRQ